MSLKWDDPKDPNDIAWYAVDCAAFLLDDTIATAAWTLPTDLTSEDENATSTVAKVKLSGGTAGESYALTLDLTTAGGQTFQRTVVLKVKEL